MSWSGSIGMRTLGLVSTAALGALFLCVSVAAQSTAQTPNTLRVEGNFAQPLLLTVEDLKRYPAHSVEVPPRDESEPASAGTPPARRYRGALLRDLVTAAKPTERGPRDLRRSYVLVTASDGYQVVFSWAELFIAPAGGSVLVAYEQDGRPLAEGEGPMALIAATDTRPARHVKWLQSIQLKTAGP